MPMEWPAGKRPVFVGAGYTMVRRYMPRTKGSNAKEAATMAIKDAGLEIDDIDGIFIWANPNWGGYPATPQVWLDVSHMMSVMPWKNIKFWLQPEAVAAGSCGGVQTAALALGAGVVDYALVIRTGHHPAGVRYRQVSTNRAAGNAAFGTTYGHPVGGAGQAVTYQRYLSKYNAKRDEMWGYVGTAHANGEDTPHSVWRGRPITEEDYLNARLIAYPMNIFDNDMPCDGVMAVVMTTEDRAKNTPHPGGYISGMAAIPWHRGGTGIAEPLENLEEMNRWHAKNLYDSAGQKPEDINVKFVYDGFSPMVWMWIEAFGFAPQGQAHAWAQRETIGRDPVTGKWGPHPLNMTGCNLGGGRVHGMANIMECAMQMMGTAGVRQVPNPEVALVESGPFGSASSFICTVD